MQITRRLRAQIHHEIRTAQCYCANAWARSDDMVGVLIATRGFESRHNGDGALIKPTFFFQ